MTDKGNIIQIFHTKKIIHKWTFCLTVCETHDIPLALYDIKLVDQLKTPISAEDLPILVSQFKNCSNFYIELVLTDADKPTTPQEYNEVRVFSREYMI